MWLFTHNLGGVKRIIHSSTIVAWMVEGMYIASDDMRMYMTMASRYCADNYDRLRGVNIAI